MAKYIVNVVGHQLKNKVVAPFGTEVDESQLMGNTNALLKAGFIIEAKAEKAKAEKVEDIKVKDHKEVDSKK